MPKRITLFVAILVFVLMSLDVHAVTFVVRVVYFVPIDVTPQQGIDAKIDRLIKDTQKFYADEMEQHGYGRKTFRLETGTNDKVILHRVNARFTSQYYRHNTDKIESELPQQFTIQNNISLILVGGTDLLNTATCGIGWDSIGTGTSRGFALVPASGHCLNVSVIAHELGHAFGLRHNTGSSTYLMGAGNDDLARCEAEWLDAHHYFNTRQTLNTAPKITRTYLPEEVSDDKIRFKIDIHDNDGLLQAHFFVPTGIELIGCSSLSGQNDTVEVLVPKSKILNEDNIIIQVMDTLGNYYLHNISTDLEILEATEGVTYLSLVNGDQPTPNTFGLNPKNPRHQWTYWGQILDNRTNNGNKIIISGTEYKRGVSVVPDHTVDAILEYDLTRGNYKAFEGYLGLGDEHDFLINDNDQIGCAVGGSVIFTFKIDGQQIFKSKRLTGSSEPVKVKFNIPSTAKELQILINSADATNHCDAAAIGDAKLLHGSASTLVVESVENETYTDLNPNANPDVNGDNKVDLVDLVIVASSFGTTIKGEVNPNPDVNRDGIVDKADILLVIEVLDAARPAPSITALPLNTQLLPNYPNPFNPETWIPYQLAKSADIAVRIYAINGELVRTLDIGHQSAGNYQTRNRAVYWDGKNAFGEPVASGVYFYTFTAGDFTATRKMLIRK